MPDPRQPLTPINLGDVRRGVFAAGSVPVPNVIDQTDEAPPLEKLLGAIEAAYLAGGDDYVSHRPHPSGPIIAETTAGGSRFPGWLHQQQKKEPAANT